MKYRLQARDHNLCPILFRSLWSLTSFVQTLCGFLCWLPRLRYFDDPSNFVGIHRPKKPRSSLTAATQRLGVLLWLREAAVKAMVWPLFLLTVDPSYEEVAWSLAPRCLSLLAYLARANLTSVSFRSFVRVLTNTCLLT